jgi:hypothetical protein
MTSEGERHRKMEGRWGRGWGRAKRKMLLFPWSNRGFHKMCECSGALI